MAVPIHVTLIPPFDQHGELSSVAHRWQKWLKSFNLFADASGCKNDKQKRQLLLHTAGAAMQTRFALVINTLGIMQMRLLHVLHPITLLEAAKVECLAYVFQPELLDG